MLIPTFDSLLRDVMAADSGPRKYPPDNWFSNDLREKVFA
jgi:hypothetical protein